MKNIKTIILCLILLSINITGINTVYAAEKKTIDGEVKLKEGVTYTYDLDGDGKEEKIKYIVNKLPSNDEYVEYIDQLNIYVNNKKLYTKAIEYAELYSLSIIDLDSNDQYLEIFFVFTGENIVTEYASFQRYINKKLREVADISSENNNKTFGKATLFCISGLGKIKGDGTFSIISDSPTSLSGIGSYYCYVPFIISNNKITYKNTDTFKLAGNSRKFKYEVNQTIYVYNKPNQSKNQIFSIEKGEKITIEKIKVYAAAIDAYDFNNSDHIKSGYAYIKNSKGQKGWIYIHGSYNMNLFEEIPGWG